MPRIAIIGAGLIGRSWAIDSRAGWEVALHDSAAEATTRARDVPMAWRSFIRHGLVDDAKTAAKRVRIASSLADALDGASYVQENTPETLEAKRAIFAELDHLAAPDAVLASSTSTIIASLFTEKLKDRHRCLVAHPVNPPHLVPLVELVGAPWTSAETIARAKKIYEQVEQVPIVVKREMRVSVLNRLQACLLSEAFRLVGDGTCRRRTSTRRSRKLGGVCL